MLGDLRSADESFAISEAWWEAGEAALGDCLGYEPVVLDLKASLRISQRRFSEAFALLDRIYAIHEQRPEHMDAHLAGRALVTKALALAEMNEPRAVDRAAGAGGRPGEDGARSAPRPLPASTTCCGT